MGFTRENLREIADRTNDKRFVTDFTTKIRKEMEKRAMEGFYHYVTDCMVGVHNPKEIIDYFELRGFEVKLERVNGLEYLKIYWN